MTTQCTANGAVLQDYKPPSLLTLNVGGAKLLVKRSALTLFDDSKLAWMFSGRWDHVLPRDHSGRIFLDLDVKWFSPITEYLSELSRGAAADDVHLPLTQLSDDDKLGVQACAEMFGLCPILARELDPRLFLARQALANVTQHIASVARLGEETKLKIGWSAPWQLLYQSSAHGATPQEFHRLCAHKPNTICLATDDKGNVFGGFTTVARTSSPGSWQPDPAAFLFCKGSNSTAMQRYCQTGTSPQHAVLHKSSHGPIFGVGNDLQFAFSSEGAIAYCSATRTYQPMPINGTSGGKVVYLFVWQVPQTGDSAPPSLTPNADAAVSCQPAPSLSYITSPVALRADMSSLTDPATTLSFHFGLWLKEQLDACDSELRAVDRRAKLFTSEMAFMQQVNATLSPEDLDGRKRAWLEKVCIQTAMPSESDPPAPPTRLKGIHNGIVYIACRGTGQLCTMRETFTQFGATPLANKYASDVWGGIVEVELDEEGCVFEDHNQECFHKLANVMRLRSIVRRPDFSGTIGSSKPAPMPAHLTATMTNMLEYLMIDSEQFFSSLNSPVEN
ncbi:hypothetical protein JKP88DRAFT_181023 [Tribonema minus]|uniref:TLDc domain-containing protein n=1 Tax=Tribonema minus TaxID=303371 RepID=A0A835Z1Y2_9STRA|nr:hypothetical protein JKP88DRAFT_181023 [Tribonema minus]